MHEVETLVALRDVREFMSGRLHFCDPGMCDEGVNAQEASK